MSITLSSHHLIVQRDIEIFRHLEDFKALSLDQIWALFFNHRAEAVIEHLFLTKRGTTYGYENPAYKRLSKLARFGYLEHSFQLGFPHIYRLGPKGHYLLRNLGKSKFKHLPPWPKELEHALLSAALGIVFSKNLNLEVIPERHLLSHRWVSVRSKEPYKNLPLPDMEIMNQGRKYRVELELSEKSHQKYLSIWKRLGQSVRESEPSVLYVVRDQCMMNKILRLAGGTFYFPGIYAARLDEFRTHLGQTAWKNYKGKEFRFEDIRNN